MFGRKKQANEHYPTHTPPPPMPKAPQTEPLGPLPPRCPLTQNACRDTCAWRVEGECAAAFFAREMFTLVEVLARSAKLPTEGQPREAVFPPDAVVLPQQK